MKISENIPDILQEGQKELPFRVPDGYFDDFQARLQARLGNEFRIVPERKIIRLRYLKPVIGLAAACAALALLVFHPFRGDNGTVDFAFFSNSPDETRIINLVEPVDDHTFFTLLESNSPEEKLEGNELELFIAANYSDYDIYLETQK